MRKIKDFFHDTNDILLAVVIVLLAAGVISWRFHILLQYPSQLAKEATASGSADTTEEVQEETQTETPESVS